MSFFLPKIFPYKSLFIRDIPLQHFSCQLDSPAILAHKKHFEWRRPHGLRFSCLNRRHKGFVHVQRWNITFQQTDLHLFLVHKYLLHLHGYVLSITKVEHVILSHNSRRWHLSNLSRNHSRAAQRASQDSKALFVRELSTNFRACSQAFLHSGSSALA